MTVNDFTSAIALIISGATCLGLVYAFLYYVVWGSFSHTEKEQIKQAVCKFIAKIKML